MREGEGGLKPARAWVLLASGRRLNLVDPQPDSWSDRDLAIGLSRAYRWGGHSCWDLPLSVAQHSLLVLVLRQQLRPDQPLTQAEALRELLHDGSEGLLGFDPIFPLKPHLGPDFENVDRRLREAIDRRYLLPDWTEEDYRRHKRADHLAAAAEAFHIAGWSLAEMRDSLAITLDPLETDPLPAFDGLKPWEPWPPRLAAALFFAKLGALIGDAPPQGAPADLALVAERERLVRGCAAAFARLPAQERQRVAAPPTGTSLTDRFLVVPGTDSVGSAEGVVVDGQRGAHGEWDLTAPFTLFTPDGRLCPCPGRR